MPCDKHELTSNIVCMFYHRPRVAIGLGGAARNLAQPLLYRSIRTNLVEAFGGDSTIFAVLKLKDRRGAGFSEGMDLLTNAEEANVRHALQFIGLKREEHLILSSDSTLPNARVPSCGTPSYVTPGRPTDLYMSLIGQLNTRQHIYQLIEADESRTGLPFEYVLYVRADLTWPYPVKPFCFWDLERQYRKLDWILFVPREAARLNLDTVANDLWSCNPMVAPAPDDDEDGNGIEVPEYYMFRHFVGITEFDEYIEKEMSGFITRQDRPNRAQDLCDNDENSNYIHLWSTGSEQQCQEITWRNMCDNLADDACPVTGEC